MLLEVFVDHIVIDPVVNDLSSAKSNQGGSRRDSPAVENFSSILSSLASLVSLFLLFCSPATFAADPVDTFAQYRLFDPAEVRGRGIILTCEYAGCADNTFIGRLPSIRPVGSEAAAQGRAVSVLEIFDIHPSTPQPTAAKMSEAYLLKWLNQNITVEVNKTKSPLSYRQIVKAPNCPEGIEKGHWEYLKREYIGLEKAHNVITKPAGYNILKSSIALNTEIQYPERPGTFRWPEWPKLGSQGPGANVLSIPNSPFRTGSIRLNQGIYRPATYEALIHDSAPGKHDAIDHYQRLGVQFMEKGPDGKYSRISDANLKAALASVAEELETFRTRHTKELMPRGPLQQMYLDLKRSLQVLNSETQRDHYNRTQMMEHQIEPRLQRMTVNPTVKPAVTRGGIRDYIRWQRNRYLDARDARRAQAAAKANTSFNSFKANFGKNIASAAKKGAISGLGSSAGVWSYLYLELLIRRQVTGDASIQAAIDDYVENRIGQIGQITTGFLAGFTWSVLFDFYKTINLNKKWKMLGTIAPTALVTTLSQDSTPRLLRGLDLERLPINYTEWRGHSKRSKQLEEILEGLPRYPSFSCKDMPAGQIVISGGLVTSTLISLKQILIDAKPWIKIFALDGKYDDLVLNLAAMSRACDGGQTIDMTSWANLVGRMKSFHDQRADQFRDILQSHLLAALKATWEQEPHRLENLGKNFALNGVAIWGMYRSFNAISSKVTGKAAQDFETIAQKLETTKNPVTTRKLLLRWIESNSKVKSAVGQTLARAEGPVVGTITAAAIGFVSSAVMINSGRILGWFKSLFSDDGTDFAERAIKNRNEAVGIVEKYLTLKDDELCNMFDRTVIPNCADAVTFDAVKSVFEAAPAAESALLKEIPGLMDIWDSHREENILGDLAGELKRWGQYQEKEERKIYVKIRSMDWVRRHAPMAGDSDFDSNGGFIPWHTSEADSISLFREIDKFKEEYLREVAPIGYNNYFNKLLDEKEDMLRRYAKVRTEKISTQAESVFFSKKPSESLLKYDAKANAGLPAQDQLWSPSNLSWSYWKQIETFRWILMQAQARTKNIFDAEQEIEELNDLFSALKPGIISADSFRNITAAFEKGKVRTGDPLGPYQFLQEASKLTGSDPDSRAKRIGLRWMALYHYVSPLMFEIIQRYFRLSTRMREVIGVSAMIPEEPIEVRQKKFFDAVGAMTSGLVGKHASSSDLMEASKQRQDAEEAARKEKEEEARKQAEQSKQKTAAPKVETKVDPKAPAQSKPAEQPAASVPPLASSQPGKPPTPPKAGTAPATGPSKPVAPPARPEGRDKPDDLALSIMSSTPSAFGPSAPITLKKPTKPAPPAPTVEKK